MRWLWMAASLGLGIACVAGCRPSLRERGERGTGDGAAPVISPGERPSAVSPGERPPAISLGEWPPAVALPQGALKDWPLGSADDRAYVLDLQKAWAQSMHLPRGPVDASRPTVERTPEAIAVYWHQGTARGDDACAPALDAFRALAKSRGFEQTASGDARTTIYQRERGALSITLSVECNDSDHRPKPGSGARGQTTVALGLGLRAKAPAFTRLADALLGQPVLAASIFPLIPRFVAERVESASPSGLSCADWSARGCTSLGLYARPAGDAVAWLKESA